MFRVEILVSTKEGAETIVKAFDGEMLEMFESQGHKILGMLIVDADRVPTTEGMIVEKEEGNNG